MYNNSAPCPVPPHDRSVRARLNLCIQSKEESSISAANSPKYVRLLTDDDDKGEV